VSGGGISGFIRLSYNVSLTRHQRLRTDDATDQRPSHRDRKQKRGRLPVSLKG
jgi:hypothetical protein